MPLRGGSLLVLAIPGVVLGVVEPASCHAGIDGRAVRGKGLGDVGTPVGRLSNNAFSDFISCCSSLRDCVWCSLFLSII